MLTATPTLTPKQITKNPERFASNFLKILDKKKELVPLRWNRMQRHFHAHRTGRDLILKARQLGSSTYVQGELFRRAVTKTTTSITLTHHNDLTDKIRMMVDRFYDNCKFGDLQPQRKYANASLTTYPDFDSSCTIGTAGHVSIGRGDTYTDLHGSEVAFWPDAESIMAGAMQGGNPDVILESTPNGALGYFYELCMEAYRGEGVWTLHFYPWWWDEEYALALSDGEVLSYTDEEQKLADAHGLTQEQIKWRRNKKKELKHLFVQEYPEDPITCFLTSGSSYFGENIAKMFNAPMNVKYNPDHEYFAGLDFGQSDDYTAMPIFDKTTKRQVDLFHDNKMAWKEIRRRIRITLFEKWSHAICVNGHFIAGIWNHEEKKIYNACPQCKAPILSIRKPRLGAETNNVGSVNIEALREDGIEIMEFTTSNASKSEWAGDAYDAFDTGGWQLQDYPVQRQEYTNFVSSQLPSGVWRLAASGNGHDDTVMGGLIALQTAITPIQIF